MTQIAPRIKFIGKEKDEIREMILNHAQKGNAFLDLYGSGQCYRLAKKRKINILSIDDGTIPELGNSTEQIQKELANKRDRMFISLKDLCLLRAERKFDTMWLDFCGAFSEKVKETVHHLPNIMDKKGECFITLMKKREQKLPSGYARSVINAVIKAEIKECFREAKVKTKFFYAREYHGQAVRYGKTGRKYSMVVYGFTWEKKKLTK